MLWVIKEVQITPPTFELLDLLTFCAYFLFSCGIYVKSCLLFSSVIWTSCPRLTCSCMTTISQEDNVSNVSMMLFYFFFAAIFLSFCTVCFSCHPNVFIVKSLLKCPFNEGTTHWYFTSDGQILKNVHILQFVNESVTLILRNNVLQMCFIWAPCFFPTFLI